MHDLKKGMGRNFAKTREKWNTRGIKNKNGEKSKNNAEK